jgi:iron complex outermembrane recepter protein
MIRRSGATALPELFRMVPGMNVARIDGNKWAVSARGFNQRFQDKLLVQVDGRTVYTPAFSGVYWDTVDYPLEDVERIEIVRGPGASLWGANAVNGIINIITKPAANTKGGFVSGGAGTTEHASGRSGTAVRSATLFPIASSARGSRATRRSRRWATRTTAGRWAAVACGSIGSRVNGAP